MALDDQTRGLLKDSAQAIVRDASTSGGSARLEERKQALQANIENLDGRDDPRTVEIVEQNRFELKKLEQFEAWYFDRDEDQS